MAPSTPTIGRSVHYVTGDRQHRPAVITKVLAPNCVNLNVLPDASDLAHSGGVRPQACAYNTTPVAVLQDEALPGEDGQKMGAEFTWHWPEHAAATEAPPGGAAPPPPPAPAPATPNA